MNPAKDERAHLQLADERPAERFLAPLPMSRDSDEDEPTLVDYLSTILEHRFLVIATTVTAMLAAMTYLFVVAPTYSADVLVQVEDKTKTVAGLDDISSVFSDKAPADTEIEIIRSRSLIGSVVDELNLTIDTQPRTFPVVGGAFYRRHHGADVASSLFGFNGFAWGGERIRVTRLQVPEGLLDTELRLVVKEGNRFELRSDDGTLLSGEVGKAAAAGEGDDRVEIFITELQARPGTSFFVTKRRRARVIEDLQKYLRISEKGKKTGILAVALDGKSATQIAAIVDAVARSYLRQNVERKSAEAEKTLSFLEQQLPQVKKEMDAAGAAYNAYQVKNGSVDLALETESILDRSVETEKQLNELELSRAELKQRFTENHPALIALRQKEAKLKADRAAMDAKMHKLPAQQLSEAKLMRDAKVSSELYLLLLNKAQELKVVKSGTIGNVRILDTAFKPYEPISPKKSLVAALAFLVGLGGGIALAFIKKAMDQGVSDPAEIENTTGVSVFATVPHSEKAAELANARAHGETIPVLAALDPSDLVVESLRSLRTALQFALVDSPNNVVTISGPRPGVGKSFLAANLAHILATAGQRVLLIDGDLRRGRLHTYFDGKRAGGVSEIISGQCTLAEATRNTPEPNLHFIATGKVPPNPSELVGSPRFKAFLSDVSTRYDLVLIDTPPILAVTDPAIIGRYAGVNLLALRGGKHPMREISVALKRFTDAGVRIHGAVLNDVTVTTNRYSANQYHYQYEYRPDDD
jgi:tyrosine-protein kinase Etk/Wzc